MVVIVLLLFVISSLLLLAMKVKMASCSSLRLTNFFIGPWTIFRSVAYEVSFDSKSTAGKPGFPWLSKRRFSHAIFKTKVSISEHPRDSPQRPGNNIVGPRTTACPTESSAAWGRPWPAPSSESIASIIWFLKYGWLQGPNFWHWKWK